MVGRRALLVCAIAIAVAGIGCGGGGGGTGIPAFVPNFLVSDVRVDTDLAGAADSVGIRVCADGDNLYVVWSDDRNGETDIYFNKSSDGGQTWLATDVRLDTDVAGAASSGDPQICRDGTYLYVVWEDARNGEDDIYFQRSVDGGDTWLVQDVRVEADTPGAAQSGDPVLAAGNGSVHVAWEDERFGDRDVCYRGSVDNGATFGTEQLINTNGAGVSFSDRPRIAAAGNRVYIVWKDDRDGSADIYVNYSQDAGISWLLQDVRLDTDVAGAAVSNDPEIDAAGNRVFVTWNDDRDGGFDIRFNRSLDGGATWLAQDVRLDTDVAGAGDSTRPQVRCWSNYVHVVWVDSRDGNSDVRHNVSADHGMTWEAADNRLDTDLLGSGTSEFVQFGVQGGNVYAAWQDDRDGATDIHFSYSTDHGQTFIASDLQCDTDTPGASNSTFPRVASDGVRVYVLWADERDGGQDVYCRSSMP